MSTRKKLRRQVERIHQALFVRRSFYGLHEVLYLLALRGMGVFNYENEKVSGEEHFLRTLFASLAAPTVLDVGAHSGSYAVRCMSSGRAVKLFAFEPNPQTFAALERCAKENGFTAIRAACGEQAGQVSFYDYRDSSGSSHASLYREVIETLHRGDAREFTVDSIRLDDFLQEQSIEQVDLLKIDTEGHELSVLKGAPQALAAGRIKLIQFEFNDTSISSRSFFQDFRALLPGFEFFRLLPDGLVPIRTYPRVYCEIFGFQNVVAVPEPEIRKIRELFGLRAP